MSDIVCRSFCFARFYFLEICVPPTACRQGGIGHFLALLGTGRKSKLFDFRSSFGLPTATANAASRHRKKIKTI